MTYTVEQSNELIEAYKLNPSRETVEFYAAKWDKSYRSVVAKLTKAGIYQKQTYKNKRGEDPKSKDRLATEIGMYIPLAEFEEESLTKAGKSCLEKILAYLKAGDPASSKQ